MSFRRDARKDANHTEIVAAFRKLQWYVFDVSQLKNCCDLMCSKNGFTAAVEVKDGDKPPSQRKLTKGEQEFKDNWKGEWRLIESVDDVIKLDEEIKWLSD